MADVDINAALKVYLDDPQSILTTDADSALTDCENDAEAYSPGLINSVLNEIVAAVGESPDAILTPSNLDTVQYLLK